MKNIIVIDLTQFNYQKLEEIAEAYNVDCQCLISNKKEGFTKLWINTEDVSIIAYATKQFKDNIFMTDSFMNDLDNIKPVEMIKKDPKPLTVDFILDKINKYGVESLNESEKRFLENQ